MSKGLKIWLLFWGFAASVLLLVNHWIGTYYAQLLVWTFGQSETAIGRWMGIAGYSPFKSIIICVAIGAVAVSHHYFSADLLEPILRRLGVVSEKKVCEDIYRRPRKIQYATVSLVSFLPDGGVLMAIIVAKKCGLNRWGAFAAIQFGNIAKNVSFGLGFTILSLFKKDVALISLLIALASSLILGFPYLKSAYSNITAFIARQRQKPSAE